MSYKLFMCIIIFFLYVLCTYHHVVFDHFRLHKLYWHKNRIKQTKYEKSNAQRKKYKIWTRKSKCKWICYFFLLSFVLTRLIHHTQAKIEMFSFFFLLQLNLFLARKRQYTIKRYRVRKSEWKRTSASITKKNDISMILILCEKGQRKTTYCKIDSLNGANCKAFVAHIASAA